MKGFRYTDEQISETIRKVFSHNAYLCDPHGACGFQALNDFLEPNQTGVFLETAHPAKFHETVAGIVGEPNVVIPERLKAFMKSTKKTVQLNNDFSAFKKYLLIS